VSFAYPDDREAASSAKVKALEPGRAGDDRVDDRRGLGGGPVSTDHRDEDHDHDHGADPLAFLSHDACVADTDRPVFEEEWQRRAFGLAVALSELRHYPWESFQRELIAAIGTWEREAGATEVWEYYEHWLAALERVVVDAGILTAEEVRGVLAAP
jgi:nitrile hydratase accessory protein